MSDRRPLPWGYGDVSLTLNPGESDLLTRILALYLEEARRAAAGSANAEIETRRRRDAPMPRDLLGQLAASRTAA